MPKIELEFGVGGWSVSSYLRTPSASDTTSEHRYGYKFARGSEELIAAEGTSNIEFTPDHHFSVKCKTDGKKPAFLVSNIRYNVDIMYRISLVYSCISRIC